MSNKQDVIEKKTRWNLKKFNEDVKKSNDDDNDSIDTKQPYMYEMENVIGDNYPMIDKFEKLLRKNKLDYLLVVEDGEFEPFNQYKFKTYTDQIKADKLFEKNILNN